MKYYDKLSIDFWIAWNLLDFVYLLRNFLFKIFCLLFYRKGVECVFKEKKSVECVNMLNFIHDV